MNFIKIGDKVINLDQVTDVNLSGPTEPATVRIIAVNGGTDFKGEEAEALRFYFTGKSVDVVAAYNHDLGQQRLREKRIKWEAGFREFAETMEVPVFGGVRDSFKSFMVNDGNLRECNQANYTEWQEWYKEVTTSPSYSRY